MKNKDLLHAINGIGSKHPGTAGGQKSKKHRLFLTSAVAACVCIAAGSIWLFRNSGSGKDAAYASYLLAKAEYPECVPYPLAGDNGQVSWDAYSAAASAWSDDHYARVGQSRDYLDGLYPFYETTFRQLLAGGEKGNRIYSPLNLYMALSMLAEVTDGDSRAQVLGLLGTSSIESVRVRANALWNANYSDDGAVTSILANSIWLNQGVSYKKSTLDTLAQAYHASSFQGKMGSPGFTGAFRGWLNEQTGGLLAEQAGQAELGPETVLALASTIYYRAQWHDKFNKNKTAPGTFHTATGDITCDFMNQADTKIYYWGENFSAINQSLEHGGAMWLILPDESVTPDDLVAGGAILPFLRAGYTWENQTYINVKQSIPKFDIVSDLDLASSLEAMGVTDIFDSSVSDFGPLAEGAQEVFVSSAKHAVRVTIDEEGCTAAAFTAMVAAGAAMPPEDEVDFILDRPFFFAITGADGSLLFAGIVEQP